MTHIYIKPSSIQCSLPHAKRPPPGGYVQTQLPETDPLPISVNSMESRRTPERVYGFKTDRAGFVEFVYGHKVGPGRRRCV